VATGASVVEVSMLAAAFMVVEDSAVVELDSLVVVCIAVDSAVEGLVLV
jgi:hypothetical protein